MMQALTELEYEPAKLGIETQIKKRQTTVKIIAQKIVIKLESDSKFGPCILSNKHRRTDSVAMFPIS